MGSKVIDAFLTKQEGKEITKRASLLTTTVLYSRNGYKKSSISVVPPAIHTEEARGVDTDIPSIRIKLHAKLFKNNSSSDVISYNVFFKDAELLKRSFRCVL